MSNFSNSILIILEANIESIFILSEIHPKTFLGLCCLQGRKYFMCKRILLVSKIK